MDYTGFDFHEGKSQVSSEYVTEKKTAMSKDAGSMTTQSQRKKNQIELSVNQQQSATDELEAIYSRQSIDQRSSEVSIT